MKIKKSTRTPSRHKAFFLSSPFLPAVFFLLGFLLLGYSIQSTVRSTKTPSELKALPINSSMLRFTYLRPDNSQMPQRIVIPSINVDIPIRVSPLVNGYWEVFEKEAGFGFGSAPPSAKEGNQVIFAHARQGLFGDLKNLKKGQRVYVLTTSQWYVYEVNSSQEVDPSNVKVISHTSQQRLTLFTCSGFLDSKRLIVSAKPV